MTIDEAIEYHERIDKIETQACFLISQEDGDYESHKRCAEEHRQLAGWLKELKQYREQETCGDVISRQAVLDTLSELNAISFYEAQEDSEECYYEIRQAVKDIPPATPSRPRGKWIDNNCSICGYGVEPWNNTPSCPRCGAEMQESED